MSYWDAVISATAGLVGVYGGARLTARSQELTRLASRSNERTDEQRLVIAHLLITWQPWQRSSETVPMALGSPAFRSVEETLEVSMFTDFAKLTNDLETQITLSELTVTQPDLLLYVQTIHLALTKFRGDYAEIGSHLLEHPSDRDGRFQLTRQAMATARTLNRLADELGPKCRALLNDDPAAMDQRRDWRARLRRPR